MAQKLSFAQFVLPSVPSWGLVVFTVLSTCFKWSKAVLKVVCVKSARICLTLWRQHRKRHLKLKEITYSVSDTESKYTVEPCFPLLCISFGCLLVLAATAFFLGSL